MADDKAQLLYNGQEVHRAELNAAFEHAALAEDRVFAELFRLATYDGVNTARAILPYAIANVAETKQHMVWPTGAGDGQVNVNPFRVIIGSRTLPATNVKRAWRDARSALILGSAALYNQVAIAANASGNPRWDLIYAVILVDASSPTVVRKVKGETSTAVASISTVVTTTQTVSLAVAAGTPAATPAFPATPGDPVGGYHVPIAYVRVPNGHTSGSTIAATQIRECAPLAQISSALGVPMVRPATGNDKDLAVAQYNTWGSAGTRPEIHVPRSMSGGIVLWPILLDLYTPVNANGNIIDDSINWRNRYFNWSLVASDSGTGTFASGNPATASNAIPKGTLQAFPTASGISPNALFGMGQSFEDDAALVAATATVLSCSAGQIAAQQAASQFGLYVDAAGVLKLFVSATSPLTRAIIRLEASAQYPNFV